jgi:hypothetical protein
LSDFRERVKKSFSKVFLAVAIDLHNTESLSAIEKKEMANKAFLWAWK